MTRGEGELREEGQWSDHLTWYCVSLLVYLSHRQKSQSMNEDLRDWERGEVADQKKQKTKCQEVPPNKADCLVYVEEN